MQRENQLINDRSDNIVVIHALNLLFSLKIVCFLTRSFAFFLFVNKLFTAP